MDFKNINLNENFYRHALPAILIFIIGWLLSGKITKIICKALLKAKVDLEIISFSRSILKYVFRIFVLMITLTKLGVDITSLIAALGAAFVTVGIALKSSLSNIASGIIIIVNKPFKIGDYIEADNTSGTVTKIELMFTTLITSDNQEVVVPNSKLTSNSILNCNKNPVRRLDLIYTLSNELEIKKIKSIFNDIILSNKKIISDMPYEVTVEKYEPSQTDFKVKLWCKTNDYSNLKNELNEKIRQAFEIKHKEQ